MAFANNKLRTVALKNETWRDHNAVNVKNSSPLPPLGSGEESEPLKGAYFWLTVFYVVYCARPEDWIPGLHSVPLAKISGVFAIIGLLLSVGRSKRGLRDFPREAFYLLLMIGIFFLSAAFSPVWKGGAFFRTLDFSKVFVAWVLTFVAVTSLARLRRVLFIQAASVAVISIVSMLKGASHPRLDGALGGIYSNPNDLGFAIVLSLPFCLAFLLRTSSILRKSAWTVSMLLMISALFLTASRGAFITFLVAGAISLWHFGIKGRRVYLIAAALLIAIVVGIAVGGPLKDRLLAVSSQGLDTDSQSSAYGSYEQRRILISRSLEGIEHYPILGIGLHNFSTYSGVWRDVHVTYLQIAVEGGVFCLILYLLFLGRGFSNLRALRGMTDHDSEVKLFAGALHSSLVGFLVGALFAPEAYQYFPYFAVAYTAVLLAIERGRESSHGSDEWKQATSGPRRDGKPSFTYAW
ncbi:MAG: O-antigen ligase family protein [Terriglobales bacterium]